LITLGKAILDGGKMNLRTDISRPDPMDILKRGGAIVSRGVRMVRKIALPILAFFLVVNSGVFAKDILGESDLGPQSTQAVGQKHVLMVAVRFPDTPPAMPIETVRRKVVSAFNTYVIEQSYGLASVNADFRGYVMLPSPLSQYKVVNLTVR
jgi:hypothetical protein